MTRLYVWHTIDSHHGQAVLNYVASDTEKTMNKWLKAYLKSCRYNA